MKIFDITNARHQEILAEELIRAKRMMLKEYNEDDIWASMSDDERWDAIASVRDDEGPDDADRYADAKWDNVPDWLSDRINLSVFELANQSPAGRTNLRAINNHVKKDVNAQKVIDVFLQKVNRKDIDSLTINQSYKLLLAINRALPGKGWNMDAGTNYNPYEMPGGQSTKLPGGGKWTGD